MDVVDIVRRVVFGLLVCLSASVGWGATVAFDVATHEATATGTDVDGDGWEAADEALERELLDGVTTGTPSAHTLDTNVCATPYQPTLPLTFLTTSTALTTCSIVGLDADGDAVSETLDTGAGLVAHFRMDDGAASAVVEDFSDAGNDGTASADTDLLTTTGKVGSALWFDGTGTRINCGSDASLDDLPSGGMSVGAWIWIDGTGLRDIFTKRDASTGGWTLRAQTTTLRFFTLASGVDADAIADIPALSAGSWIHVFATLSAGQAVTLYINGAEATSYSTRETGSGATADASADLFAGCYYTGSYGNYFAGRIDDGRVYDRVLSAREIELIYAAGAGTEGRVNTTDRKYASVSSVTCYGMAAGDSVYVEQPRMGVVDQLRDADGNGTGVFTVAEDWVLKCGNGVDATTMTSTNESWWFGDGSYPQVQALGELRLGVRANGAGSQGSFWSLALPSGALTFLASSSVLDVSASTILLRDDNIGYLRFNTGTIRWTDSALVSESSVLSALMSNTMYLARSRFSGGSYPGSLYGSPQSAIGCIWSDSTFGIYNNSSSDVTVSDALLVNNTYACRTGASGDLTLVDPVVPIANPYISTTGDIVEAYTVNATITDADGVAVAGATVTMTSDAGTDFSVTTGADGTIAEQTVTAKTWTGTDETLEDTTTKTLTVTTSDGGSFALSGIVLDEAKDWRLAVE